MERYFQRLKNPKKAAEEEMSQPNRTSRDRARRDLTKQLAIDSSSNSSRESDETFSTTTTSSSRVTGPTTRRAWSDWVGGVNGLASVSRSFSEGEAQPITNGTGRGGRILPTRQRQNKKLRRKASETEEPEEPKLPAPRRRAVRGRVRKPKPKKTIKINGLDLLHSQTLLSTSPQGNFDTLFDLFLLEYKFTLNKINHKNKSFNKFTLSFFFGNV